MGPSTWTQLLITALLVLPGFVYRGVRVQLRGPHPDDRDLPTRLFRGLEASVVFALVYVLVIGPTLAAVAAQPRLLADSPRLFATYGLIGIFIVPVVTGLVLHIFYLSSTGTVKRWWQVRRRHLSLYDHKVPTAWDYAFRGREEGQFVRVKTSDGCWLAGWAPKETFTSAYPEAHEIYLPDAYRIDKDGEIGEREPDSTGIWINCTTALAVEFFRADDPRESDTTESPDDGDDHTTEDEDG